MRAIVCELKPDPEEVQCQEARRCLLVLVSVDRSDSPGDVRWMAQQLRAVHKTASGDGARGPNARHVDPRPAELVLVPTDPGPGVFGSDAGSRTGERGLPGDPELADLARQCGAGASVGPRPPRGRLGLDPRLNATAIGILDSRRQPAGSASRAPGWSSGAGARGPGACGPRRGMAAVGQGRSWRPAGGMRHAQGKEVSRR